MAVAGQRPTIGKLQIALGALQCLDRRFFVHANDHCVLRRRHVEADNIRRLGNKLWIVALAPGFTTCEVDFLLPQNAPDMLFVDVTQPVRNQRPRPAGIASRRRLIQDLQDALAGLRRIARFLARSRPVLQPPEAMIREPMPPDADNPRFYPDRSRYRSRARSFGRQQNNPSPPDIALGRRRRAAPSLKHRAFLRLQPNLSCLESHPYLESRLRLLAKWVLVTVLAERKNALAAAWRLKSGS